MKQETVEEDGVEARGTEKLVIKRQQDGGDISILQELPEPEYGELREAKSEVGRTNHEFPLSRDRTNTEVTFYRRIGGNGETYSQVKVFETDFSTEMETLYDREDIAELFDKVKKLPELKERINNIASYEEMVKKQSLIREYENTYKRALSMYHDSSVSPSKKWDNMFEIEQYPHGFYKVAMFHHRNLNQVMSQHLEKHELGFYNVVWGGFIIEPEDFTEIHETFKPFRRTPGDNE